MLPVRLPTQGAKMAPHASTRRIRVFRNKIDACTTLPLNENEEEKKHDEGKG